MCQGCVQFRKIAKIESSGRLKGKIPPSAPKKGKSENLPAKDINMHNKEFFKLLGKSSLPENL